MRYLQFLYIVKRNFITEFCSEALSLRQYILYVLISLTDF